MSEGTPSPYYRHERALWNGSSPDLDDDLDAFRADMAARSDGGYGFWQQMRDVLAASPEATAPPAPTVRMRTPTPAGAVVYYIRFADRVKIGTTINLRNRLQSIPHDEVLATEPGTYDVEAQRHVEFADLRVTGEWFRYDEPLRSHIERLRKS